MYRGISNSFDKKMFRRQKKWDRTLVGVKKPQV